MLARISSSCERLFTTNSIDGEIMFSKSRCPSWLTASVKKNSKLEKRDS
jgi:hypothetical protein